MASKFEKCQYEQLLLFLLEEEDKGNSKAQRMGLQEAHLTVLFGWLVCGRASLFAGSQYYSIV